MRIEGSSFPQEIKTGLTQSSIPNGGIKEEVQAPIDSHTPNFPGEKQLIEVIEKSNSDLKLNNTSLKFSIHEKTKEIVVKVVDSTTNEVVREIPPEKILDMVAAMLERTGLFMDKKV